MPIAARMSPIEIAEELFETRFSGAEVLFVAGSFRRNESTETSDIDLVVVYENLPHAFRESFLYKGWPVEAFVHDPETMNHYFWERDAMRGAPALPYMVIEGQAIPESHPLVFKLKSLADRVLEVGPQIYNEEQLIDQRYAISDLLDDLRAPRNDFEAVVIAAKLHERLGEFWFRAQGRWSASGKHIPRRMHRLDPNFAECWQVAFAEAFSGKRERLIELTEGVLDRYGGYFFDGYRKDASPEWRKPIENRGIEMDIDSTEMPKPSGLLPDEETLCHDALGIISVRLVQSQDVPALRILLNRAYKRLSDMGLNFNATFQDDELTRIGLVDGRSFVLEHRSEIVGTVKLREFNAVDQRRCLYVSRFAVQPELQGNGLGLFLLRLAERIARREGYVCMQLDTAQPASHLLRFYQSYGFQIVRPIYYEGKTYVSWILEKTL